PAASTGTAGGGLFGAKPATTTGGGLFGSSGTAGGGLFGSGGTAAAGTGAAGGGLFGSANTGASGTGSTGLFGSTAGSTGGGLFGAKPAAAAPAGATGGLFGSAGAGTGGGGFGFGFGGQAPAQAQPAQSLFQAQQPQLQAQPPALQAGQLAAQIDKQPYGANALFDTSRLASKATAKLGSSHLTATPLRASTLAPDAKETERKKRGLNLQLLSSPHVATAASSRLRARGFAAPAPAARMAAAPPTPATTARELKGGLFGRDGFLSPESQLPHSNVKRLVITRRPSFGSAGGSPARGRASAAAADATPVRERAATATELLASPPHMENPWAEGAALRRAPAETLDGAAGGTVDGTADETAETDADEFEEVIVEEDGGYWMRPALDDLRAMSTQQLRAVRNFTVGRDGVGQVSFNRAVDLTGVGSLGAIAGGVVLFGDRVCTVYPDESNKPPRGQGLNVPATISLHDCWPVDRATGAAVTHMDDARVRKHIRRLRRIDETEFVDFVDGTWIFRVEHFSRYGLDDDDLYDDDEDLEQPPAVQAQGPMQGFEQATAAPALQTQGPVDGPRAVADPPSSQPRRYVPPPPQQLLAGGRRAASLRRAPVKRASLFSAPPPPAEPVGCKRRADAIEPARPAAPVARPAAARELDLPPPSKYLRASESRLARELLAAPQPYARSLTHGRSGLSADAGLMMARSFRVAFGAQGQLVYLRGGAASSVVAIDSVARHVNASPDAAVYANAARAQWEHSAVARGADGLPRVCVRDDASVAAVLRSAAAAGQGDDSEERRVLELAAVLFDRDVTDHVQA
ncbi:hypothetical protein LPJ70_004314, partial [Coemansia sp. RSA 2708]